ncbi:hypothetical protein, partial [Neisseria meningitidis]|uniref:hypothetical protein n=1 Tax=Neisseria meningitidis TaxID=487 RepID=UPI001EE67317
IKKCTHPVECVPSLQRRNRGEKSSCIKQLDGGNYPPFLIRCQLFFENLPDRFKFCKKLARWLSGNKFLQKPINPLIQKNHMISLK